MKLDNLASLIVCQEATKPAENNFEHCLICQIDQSKITLPWICAETGSMHHENACFFQQVQYEPFIRALAKVIYFDHQVERSLRNVARQALDISHTPDRKVASPSKFADKVQLEISLAFERRPHRVLCGRGRAESPAGEAINRLDEVGHLVCMSKAHPTSPPTGNEMCL